MGGDMIGDFLSVEQNIPTHRRRRHFQKTRKSSVASRRRAGTNDRSAQGDRVRHNGR